MTMTIDKKTKKLLKVLQKDHGCILKKSNSKQTIFVMHPDVKIEGYLLHVGHSKTEKSYHPLRRWAKSNLGVGA